MTQLRVVELGELDPDSVAGREWDALVASNEASGFMQSLPWAVFRRTTGYSSLHLGVYRGDQLLGGAICYSIRLNAGGAILVAPEGPVLPWEDGETAREALKLILQEVKRAALDAGAIAFRIEPRIGLPTPRLLRGFRRSPVDLIPQETMYLSLAAAPEQLLTAMRPKARYNVRLADRRGVAVREERSPATAREFHALLVEAGNRDGFFVEPLPFFLSMAESLCSRGMGRFLIAEHDGDILGGLFLVTFGRRSTYLYGGISNRRRNLMAGYALQWAAIRIAMEAGCDCYDFYGYEPFGAPSHLYAGFSRFKKQFGGQAVRFAGSQELFFLDTLTELVVKAVHEVEQAGQDGRKERVS